MDLNHRPPAPKSHHASLLTSVEMRCSLSDFIRISCGSFAESCGFVLNLRKPSIYEIIYNGFLNLLGCVRRGELRSGSSHDPGPTRDLRSYVVKFYSFIVWMSVIVLISINLGSFRRRMRAGGGCGWDDEVCEEPLLRSAVCALG